MVTQELLDFIQNARAQGMEDNAISQNLLQAGWDQESVNSGLVYGIPQAESVQNQNDQLDAQDITAPVSDEASYSTSAYPSQVGGVFEKVNRIVHHRYFWPLVILTLLIVVGVIGWVFYALSHLALPSSSPQPIQSTFPTPSSHSVAVPATTTTTFVSHNARSNSCPENDMKCFISAARTCTPTTMRTTTPVPLFGFTLSGTGTTKLSRVKTPGYCNYVTKTDTIKVTISAKKEKAELAQGMTQAQIQTQIANINQHAQKGVGMTVSCTLSTHKLIEILTKISQGKFSSGTYPASECTTTLPHTVTSKATNDTALPSPKPYTNGYMTPANVAQTTVFLYQHDDTTLNGLEFKVVSLTATKLAVTVTDHKTGKSISETFAPVQTKSVLGHTMTLKSIKKTNTGIVNGQETYTLHATLSYGG